MPRHFHDDQFYQTGKDDRDKQNRPWWATLLWPFSSGTVHRAADEQTAKKMARTEIRTKKNEVGNE